MVLMDKKKRCCITLNFVFCVAGIVLISVALATEYWIQATPVRIRDGTDQIDGNGSLHFGLFHGEKEFNSGLGTLGRDKEIWIVCDTDENVCGWSFNKNADERVEELNATISSLNANNSVSNQETAAANAGLLNFGLWVAAIVFAGLGIVWGLVGAFLAIVNLATRPIETITGPMGLYVWNTLACLFSLLCVVMYTVLYYMDFKQNVLTQEEQDKDWTSKDRAYFGYSFWLVVGASGCFAINIIFVMLAGAQFRPISYKASMNDKTVDGVMMY